MGGARCLFFWGGWGLGRFCSDVARCFFVFLYACIAVRAMRVWLLPGCFRYLVSCVNSRAEDIAAAADVLRGNKVADGVEFYVAAASNEVQAATEKAGDWDALLEAGAIPLPPGCGPCIGLGKGLLQDGEVGISATNRNFRGRMGSPEAEAYLASPLVVAASAMAGYIASPIKHDSTPLISSIEIAATDKTGAAVVAQEMHPDFPKHIEGRLIFCPEYVRPPLAPPSLPLPPSLSSFLPFASSSVQSASVRRSHRRSSLSLPLSTSLHFAQSLLPLCFSVYVHVYVSLFIYFLLHFGDGKKALLVALYFY